MIHRHTLEGLAGHEGHPGMRNLASGLAKYGSVGQLRAATPMPVDSQRLIDQAVIEVGLDRLVLVRDLYANDLTLSLPNWLAVPTVYQEKTGRAGSAKRSMVPEVRGERQLIDRSGYTTPVFCTWDDFDFGIREQLASERAGAPLNTAHIKQAVRNVNEAAEDQAWNGLGINIDGNTAYGVLNEPNVNTYQYLGGATGRAWDEATKTGQHILEDVIDMAEIVDGDNYRGPYKLYVPTAYWFKLMQPWSDGTTTFDRNIYSFLTELRFGGQNLQIEVADKLPANRTALIQLDDSVIDVIDGQQPTTVSWESPSGWHRYYVVLSCQVVRAKSDYAGNSGIVVGNTV